MSNMGNMADVVECVKSLVKIIEDNTATNFLSRIKKESREEIIRIIASMSPENIPVLLVCLKRDWKGESKSEKQNRIP